METLDIKFGAEKIKAKIINMEKVHIIAPFFLACSHNVPSRNNKDNITYSKCNKNKNAHLWNGDGRVCCNCGFYNGGSVLALDWGGKEGINFTLYPFKSQESLEEMKRTLETISKTGEVRVKDIWGKITKRKYEIKNPVLT